MERKILIVSDSEKSCYWEEVKLEKGEIIKFYLKRFYTKDYFSQQPIIAIGHPGDEITLHWCFKKLSFATINGVSVFEVDAYYREDVIFAEVIMEGKEDATK